MFNHLFIMTNVLSKTLQDPDLDFSAAMSLIDATIETLQSYRSEKQWKEIWNEALTVEDGHDIEISSLPRKRKHKLPAKLCCHDQVYSCKLQNFGGRCKRRKF
ncbi:Zinc finger MYM-type protein 1-like [Oopsacas minuta]|uniref:Zinc finger MYM-type protein 1-like n=1 Tax=Oopsacas minuta TaxID=111878 RepID=A0AAV7K6N1_9METZ|nr:Zinc finger MYM-type protein 1-like [Oopsacas minuta]